jgi:hypothetical protein
VWPDEIDYAVSLETPTPDHYRLGWVPGPDVELAGMWSPAVVTDDAGQDYLGLRGFGDFIPGMTHTVSPFCGFRALQPNLDGDPPHLYPEYAGHDWFEPFEYMQTEDSASIAYDSGRLVRDADGCHWYDADGRWEIHGRTISKIFVVHVPKQPGIDQEVYYRHELLAARGTVNGVSVAGYLHQDYCYGPPGTTYTDLPIARQLEGMWVSWIHEYTDGEVGGGCFWQGRGGLTFSPGYLLSNGETTAHRDVDAKLTFNDRQRAAHSPSRRDRGGILPLRPRHGDKPDALLRAPGKRFFREGAGPELVLDRVCRNADVPGDPRHDGRKVPHRAQSIASII